MNVLTRFAAAAFFACVVACSSASDGSVSAPQDAGINYGAPCHSRADCTGGGSCRFDAGCSPDQLGECRDAPMPTACKAETLCGCDGSFVSTCMAYDLRYAGPPTWVNGQMTCGGDAGDVDCGVECNHPRAQRVP